MLAHDCLLYEHEGAWLVEGATKMLDAIRDWSPSIEEGRSVRVAPKTNREVVEQYVQGLITRDLDKQGAVCAVDMVVEYPQSGERLSGWANIRAAAENYPGGLPTDLAGKVIGGEDKWVVGPSFNVVRIEGTGDVYTLVGSATYPDGKTWQLMALVELKSGKIAKATEVYGEPFEPPEWRSKWVERQRTTRT